MLGRLIVEQRHMIWLKAWRHKSLEYTHFNWLSAVLLVASLASSFALTVRSFAVHRVAQQLGLRPVVTDGDPGATQSPEKIVHGVS